MVTSYQARRLRRIHQKYAGIAYKTISEGTLRLGVWSETPEYARRGWRALARTLWMDPWPKKTLR